MQQQQIYKPEERTILMKEAKCDCKIYDSSKLKDVTQLKLSV